MEKYIEREAAIVKLTALEVTEPSATMIDAKRLLAEMPAADVAPVVHGKWVPSEGNPGFLVCSACGDCYVVDEWVDGRKWQYCPACGAKMDGKDEET